MNWEAIGAIGETLSAGGVIVTLLYLTVQLRQNTQAMKSATFQSINEGMTGIGQMFATDAELPRVLLQGQGGLGTLTSEDRVRLSFALMMTFRRLHAVHVQCQLGMIAGENSPPPPLRATDNNEGGCYRLCYRVPALTALVALLP